MRPVRMKKVSAVVLDDKKDGLMRDLKERGLIQFLDVNNSPSFKDFEVPPAATSWIHIKAAEYLSRVDAILDAFRGVSPETGTSIIGEMMEREEERIPVTEGPAEEFFGGLEAKVKVLEERVSGISSRLERLKKEKEDFQNSREAVAILKRLGVGPRDLVGYAHLKALVGVLPTSEVKGLREELERLKIEYLAHAEGLDKKDSVMLILSFKEKEGEVIRALRIHRLEELQFSTTLQDLGLEEAVARLDDGIASLAEEEETLLGELKAVAQGEKAGLLQLRELLQVEKFMDETNVLFGKTRKTFVLCGWVPQERVEEAVRAIQEKTEGLCVTSVEEPEEEDEPPSLLSNPPAAKPLELLTETYGPPSYHEIDPTPIMAVTFPLIFGLMFGDVGQGIVMMGLGYFLGFRLKLKGAAKMLGRTILLCGFFATVAGFLYGSVFGLEGHYMKEFLGFELHPLWLSPMATATDAIRYALFIGIAFLVLGCLINMINEIAHHKFLDAVVSPYGLAGVWLLVGGTLFVSTFGLTDITGAVLGNRGLFVLAILAPLGVMTVGEWHVTKISLGMAAFEAFENGTRYLVNSISHARIMILAIVHGALSSIMVTMMLLMPESTLGSVGKAVVFVGGNIAILVMEMFVSFIQTMRLHYYEWFSKFYKGDGTPFTPFRVIRRYTYLKTK
ncbi:MAG: V-type ATPase 116kDa subunit family protein [Candidatus Hydrothermarchaeota archaeon]